MADYSAERVQNQMTGRMPVLTVRTWTPSKYRLVDLETGQAFAWSPVAGRWKEITPA